jgi:sodium-dependent dicarboxylate transporter 2/3/5
LVVVTRYEEDHVRNFDPKYIIKLLVGPLVLLIIALLPFDGLDYRGQLCLGVYSWIIIWWMLQPVPWAVSSFIPLFLFPALGVATFKESAAMYGQGVVFFIIVILLLGEAIKKSGLGARFALSIMSVRIIKGSVLRFMFIFMFCTYILSWVISTASISIMVPIGIATIDYITHAYEEKGQSITTRKMAVFVSLGALYARVAGSMAVVTALVHNVIAVGLMEEISGYSINFVQWSEVGFILSTIAVVLSFFVLRLFYKPEVSSIPAGREFFEVQKKQLGKWKILEINALIVLGVLVILWVLPTFVNIEWLDLWTAAMIGLPLLFILPSNPETGERLVSASDFMHLNWNVIWLVGGGVGLAGMATKLGVMTWVASMLSETAEPVLLVISGIGTAVLTNFLSGTASVTSMSTIMFAVVANTGINPAVVAHVIPAAAVGVVFPWAGMAAGVTFATGHFSIKQMFQTGIVFTIILITMATLGSMLLVPLLAAFTAG